jgi:predicted nucleotidyltransferase
MLSNSLLSGVISKTLLAVLTELFGPAEPQLHLRELERRTGLKLAGLRRILTELEAKGIVNACKSGNRIYYSANSKCPIYQELKMLIAKTTGLADHLRRALEPFSDKINFAYIYGSFADGTADAESDVDVMVVGDVDSRTIAGVLGETSIDLAREVNPSVYDVAEYNSELKDNESFISRVHNDQKIILIGEIDELSN